MTQVAHASSSALKEEINVVIPDAQIQTALASALAQKAKTVRMPGFRPGKAPLKMVAERYMSTCLEEAVNYLIQSEIKNLIKDRKDLAVRPTYRLSDYKLGDDLKFVVGLEKMPDITLHDDVFDLDLITYTVQEDDLEALLPELFENLPALVDVKDRKAIESGDAIVLEFDESCHDSAFLQKFVENNDIMMIYEGPISNVLRHNLSMIPVGSTFDFTHTFDKKTPDVQLRNRKLHFKGTFKGHLVREDRLTTLADIKALQKYNAERYSTDMLKDIADKRIQGQIRLYHKRLLLDALAARYTFDLPPSLVSTEFNSIWERLIEEMKADPAFASSEDLNEKAKEMASEYLDIAVRRVRLGLVISKIATRDQIQVTDEMIQEAVYNMAMRYPKDARKIINHFRKDHKALESLVAPMVEDQVVAALLDKIEKKPRHVTFKEINNLFKGILPGYEEDDEEASTESSQTEKAPSKKSKKTSKSSEETKTTDGVETAQEISADGEKTEKKTKKSKK